MELDGSGFTLTRERKTRMITRHTSAADHINNDTTFARMSFEPDEVTARCVLYVCHVIPNALAACTAAETNRCTLAKRTDTSLCSEVCRF